MRKYLFNFYNLVFRFLLLHSSFLCLLIMATRKDDSLLSMSVRLNGKKYLYWSYVITNFFQGKKMWGYVSRTYMIIPKNIEEEDVVLSDIHSGFANLVFHLPFSFCKSWFIFVYEYEVRWKELFVFELYNEKFFQW